MSNETRKEDRRKKLDNSIRQLICRKYDAGKPPKVISIQNHQTVTTFTQLGSKRNFRVVNSFKFTITHVFQLTESFILH